MIRNVTLWVMVFLMSTIKLFALEIKNKIAVDSSSIYLITNTLDTTSLKRSLSENAHISFVTKDDYKKRLLENKDGYVQTQTYLIKIQFDWKKIKKSYNSIESTLAKADNVIQVAPSIIKNGVVIGNTGYVFVKTSKSGLSQKQIEDIRRLNYTVVGRNPLREDLFMLRPISFLNAQEQIVRLYELNKIFYYAEMDYLVKLDFGCAQNNSLFDTLWGLSNSGQSGGTQGYDIHACSAWSITKGDPSIKVAVVDQGVESTHEDLQGNVIAGYDAISGSAPSQIYGSHGTHCSGIIASKDNTIGVVGVAPNCKIVPVSFDFLPVPDPILEASILHDAIYWSWKFGNADIISNSWSCDQSALVDDAIQEALDFGRNGLGCIVVFSSGNNDNNNCNYPANGNPNVIAVGAINRCGQRSRRADVEITLANCDPWCAQCSPGSAYGPPLDIVAPGTRICTTDLMGQAGSYPGHYYHEFGGTSAACPYVAGVAALVLSANKFLTYAQVKTILESTSQKISTSEYIYTANSIHPNGLWNEKLGYGLVDAFGALLLANPSTCSASVVLTTNSATFKDHNTPGTYGNNNNCEWLIQPPGASHIILNFNYFNTVNADDILKIYDGANSAAPLIGTFYGNTIPSSITSTSGSLYLNFTTDAMLTSAGWELHYFAVTQSSSLNDYEYWFDTNYAEKVVGNNSASTSIAEYIFNANVPNTLTPNQIHAFHFRCKDDIGRWSSVITHDFYQTGASNLIAYEYWFDNNIADKTVVNFSSPYAQINLNPGNTTVNTSALSNGLHSFHFRTKSENGMWSSALTHDFYKVAEGTLSGYEYWFDDDYAARISTTTPVSSIIDITEFNTLFPTIGLANGLHQFNFRAKSQNGYWSSVVSHHFYKLGGSGLVAYQYWFDHDYSNANTWNASGPSQQFNINPLNAVFSLANLSSGLHQFHFRTQDEGGSWSAVLSQDFYILGGKLTQYEYWFNADYASRIDNAFSPTDDYQIQSTLNVTSLPLGSNLLHVRFKNNQGVWSSVMTQGFCKGLGDSSISIRFFIEGYYTGNNTMQAVLFNQGVSSDLTISDSLEVQLRGDTYPYPVVGSKYVSQKTNGLVELDMPNVPAGYYYVVIKHRNALETWSANTLYKGDCSLSYDFTTAANKAFGDNQKEVAPGVFALYSGDNFQDGSIDAFDYLDMAPDIINGNSGFLSTDLNGDGVVDAFDYLILDPNIQSGIGAMMP